MHMMNENIKYKKWLTCSAIPNFIFSISLRMISKQNEKITNFPWKKLNACSMYKADLTHSDKRTVKFIFVTSCQPISCRINDLKYFIRIRVSCLFAVWLKQFTQIVPDINCKIVASRKCIPKAIASATMASWFSSAVAFILFQKFEILFFFVFNMRLKYFF